MSRVDEIFKANPKPIGFFKAYLGYLGDLCSNLDPESFEQVATEIQRTRLEKKKIFFIGNGGSAATAAHFANDVGIGTRAPTNPFKAISLSDNSAIVTAIANDEGYDQIFVSQLRTLLEPGDLVVAISASGNSPNILKAVDYAKDRGNRVIGVTGFDGGELTKKCDIRFHVQTPKGDYGPVEDVHSILNHVLGSYLRQSIKAEN